MRRLSLREQPTNEIRKRWRLHKRIRIWIYQNIVPPIVYVFVNLLTSTYRWRQLASKELLDLMSSGKPFAVAVWHSDMLLSQSIGKRLGWNDRTVIMVALSQAGEVESRILNLLGYYVVRGSARERGKEALEDMKDILNQGALAAMVVDGPSGPAREVKAGVVELARYCGVPIVPVSFIRGNEWVLPTWDGTRIPKPFSRCITTSTKPIYIPRRIGNDTFEKIQTDIRETLVDLEGREIGWDQAVSVEMKLLSVFGIRNSIVRIEELLKGLTEEEFAGDGKPHGIVLGELRLIERELKKIKERYYRERYPEIDWKAISRMRKTLSRLDGTCDGRDVWAVVKKEMPDLKMIIEAIVERCPSYVS